MRSVQSAVSWCLAEAHSQALRHFMWGSTETESLGSAESHAVNAVSQIRLEGMLFRSCQDFQYSAKYLNLSFHCPFNS